MADHGISVVYGGLGSQPRVEMKRLGMLMTKSCLCIFALKAEVTKSRHCNAITVVIMLC